MDQTAPKRRGRPPMGDAAKTRAEINRQNYLRNQEARKAKALERKGAQVDAWKSQIAEWDKMNEWTELPPWETIAATGLSEWAVRSAVCGVELDEEAEESWT